MESQILTRPYQSGHNGAIEQLPPDLERIHILMVNAYLVGEPDARPGDWVLVDAGLPFSASQIIHHAERRFGAGTRPAAIILTHGHFDHVGAIHELLRQWHVPVYAHELELPYLTGRSDYPPPDPSVGGGMMARSAFLYPRRGIDLGSRVQALPPDGSVPHMPGWRWIHTPGHAPGHVSFFRDSDRALIAGDAFVTQKQESFWGVVTEHQRVHGPPAYFTIDWDQAKHSVRRLAELHPAVAATGHGIPMSGERLFVELQSLALKFDELAVPRNGRYVRAPAIADESGIIAVPPPVSDPLPKIAAAMALVAVAGIAYALVQRRRS
jgi:glyoxylase-like metal-dependent hydrolase (beta-lactamase superfamily II)